MVRNVGTLDLDLNLSLDEYFFEPAYLGINQENNFIYITDSRKVTDIIQIFDKNGDERGAYGDNGGGNKEFIGPLGIAAGNVLQNNFYVFFWVFF